MGAAAQFDRIGLIRIQVVTHGEHAHLVAILFAEQGFCTGGDGLVGRQQAGGGIGILADDGVDLDLDRCQLFRRHRLWVREVEAQALGGDQRAPLADMAAQNALERGMQQMGRRMVGARGAAPFLIDLQIHCVAGGEAAFDDFHQMNVKGAQLLLGVGHLAARLGRGHVA